MDYFSSTDSSLNRLAISKSAACSKMSISRTHLYYKPNLPAKDLLLKCQIESVLLEHRAYGYRRIAIALNVNPKRVRRSDEVVWYQGEEAQKKTEN